MKEVCVVHLVWSPFGIEYFERFVRSYKTNPGSLEHDLLVVFNGFNSLAEIASYHDFARQHELNYSSLVLERHVWDIPAYFAAARSSDSNYVCFLNSYSEMLDRAWLSKMHRWIARPNVGLVGATGTFESYYSNQLGDKPPARSLLHPGSFVKRHRDRRRKRKRLEQERAWFGSFPNPHIRTNAFMLRREIMLGLKTWEFATKMDCYRFESGGDGMTAQVEAMNLEALVVGRDGNAYGKDKWRESATFRSGDQRNLLVDDNHTVAYEKADADTKRLWERYAWGDSPQ